MLKIDNAVNDAGGILPHKEAETWKGQYRELLGKAEIECPPPDKPAKVKRGRINAVRRETYWKGLLIMKRMCCAL